MNTVCKNEQVVLGSTGRREIVGKFNGGTITSDGGVVLLQEAEKRVGIIRLLSGCFEDFRDPGRIEHTVEQLLSQRIYGLCSGYEDLNDHDTLRIDPMFGLICGKADPSGNDRKHERDKGKPLAGKSTLNRMELSVSGKAAQDDRYKKISADTKKMNEVFAEVFLKLSGDAPKLIFLDIDPTDVTLHGNQEGRHFHGYYDSYCYLPLYFFCGSHLLSVILRTADEDPAEGVEAELSRLVKRIREVWPNTWIIVRADSSFSRESNMKWCEDNGVDFIFGLSKNSRLLEIIREDLVDAAVQYTRTGRTARIFDDFEYQTVKTWSRPRRVISKAEYGMKGENPRFVVTSLRGGEYEDEQYMYKKVYCARGDMENRIKEQQYGLFSDRASAGIKTANELRMYFSAAGYVLMNAVRILGLTGSSMESAQCPVIRTKLLKIGAQIRITARKIWISWSENYPFRGIFLQSLGNIMKIPIPA
jgi:hypothetical protein